MMNADFPRFLLYVQVRFQDIARRKFLKGNIGEKINWSPTFFFHNSHTRKCVSTRAASFLGSSLFVTVGTRWIYRPRVLGSVFSGGEREGAGERLSYFPKGQLVTILEDLITYIYTLLSYARWSFGVFLWELFTLGKLASSSSSSFLLLYR